MAVTLLAAGLAATPAPARETRPDIWDRGCGDDEGIDRCNEAVQRKMRALYGLDPIERTTRHGQDVRRAMIVDGYGRDLLAISFTRNIGGTALVELRLPCAGKPGCPAPLLAPVSADAWAKIATPPQGSARGRPAPKGKPDGDIVICTHGWVVAAEAAGPHHKGGTKRTVESACAHGPIVAYAFAMADVALAELPDCAVLKPGVFRNTPSLLSVCASLQGSRRSAGEAYLIARDIDDDSTRKSRGLGAMLARGAQDKASALEAALKDSYFYSDAIIGSDDDHARITGGLSRHPRGTSEYHTAELELDFVREDGRMVIAGYRLGEFRLLRQGD